MAVWDSFHANGIEIPFLQRDLHIKSAVPLEISQDSPPPLSPTNEQQLGNF
jgi:small-conductance mechanosensitive channel